MSSTDAHDPGPAASPALDDLPRLTRRQVRLSTWLTQGRVALAPVPAHLAELLGERLRIGPPEVLPRAAGLRRPGAIAQLTWPRLSTRLGIGLDTPLAHYVVDRLLGHRRDDPEYRLQVTPVEWGILSFVVARLLEHLDRQGPGPLGPWDLLLDRVGPEPLPVDGLGSISTVVWPVHAGPASGSVRLWLPELLVALLLVDEPPGHPDLDLSSARLAPLSSVWSAQAGLTRLPRGLSTLRAGVLLPIDGAPLHGTAASPSGPITLTTSTPGVLHSIDAEAVPGSSGSRVRVLSSPRVVPQPQEPRPVDPTIPPTLDPSPSPSVSPADLPVTLVVELGRLTLPLSRLADLRPGQVLDLSRNSREPVELTSGGKLVARGELIQIDTELAVRVLSVHL